MTTRDPADYTAEDLNDPSVSAETLQKIAAKRSDLWPAVQKHPNSYQGLNDWISAQQGAQATAPTSHADDAADAVTKAAKKVSDGAKSAVSSAKDAIHNATAPAAAGAAAKPALDLNKILKQPADVPTWVHWAKVATPVAAILGFVGLLLPHKFGGNFLSGGNTWGVIALIGFIAAAVLWALDVFAKQTWSDKALAWVAEIASLLGLILGGALALSGVGGFGSWLLFLASLALHVSARAYFWPKKHEAK